MSVFDLSFEVALGFGPPGGFTSEHLIEDDTNGPNIAFEAVHILIKGFKGHVNRRAYIVGALLFDILLFDGESKISDFSFSIDKKDIGRFEIPMDDTVLVDSAISIDDLFEDVEGFEFRDDFFVFEEFRKVTALAKLSNDTCVVFGIEDFVELEDVRDIFEKFEDFDLIGEEVFMYVALDKAEVDHLNGDLFICIDKWEYLSVRSCPCTLDWRTPCRSSPCLRKNIGLFFSVLSLFLPASASLLLSL